MSAAHSYRHDGGNCDTPLQVTWSSAAVADDNWTTFDLFFPEFTQLNQDIPSPWGMPAFETINKSSLGTFFASYDTFETIVLPDFTGVRVRAYNDIKDVAVHLKHLC